MPGHGSKIIQKWTEKTNNSNMSTRYSFLTFSSDSGGLFIFLFRFACGCSILVSSDNLDTSLRWTMGKRLVSFVLLFVASGNQRDYHDCGAKTEYSGLKLAECRQNRWGRNG